MAAFGEGPELFRVDVVLWPHAEDTPRVESILDDVIALLTSWQDGLADAADELILASITETYSHDFPAPTGELGVSCWVRADGVGGAAQTGHDTVSRAYREVTGRPAALWDLRLLPRTAMADESTDEPPASAVLSHSTKTGLVGRLRRLTSRTGPG